MRTLLRQDFKRLLRSENFKSYFPEYSNIFSKIESGEYKIGCCNFPETLFREMIKLVMGNATKWKEFLKTDGIALYFDGKIHKV